jgi:dihydrofolate reductase
LVEDDQLTDEPTEEVMRLVATEYLSLDGVFEEPGRWSGPWFNEQAADFKFAELMASDAQLLGRKTYEGFAAAWPTMSGTGEFGVTMNTMRKYVVSSTLASVDWAGSQLVTGDVLAAVRGLRDQPGRDLLLAGSGQLFNTLHAAGLIDLYRFMVHPVVLGVGVRLFTAPTERRALTLVSSTTFDTGIVMQEYTPAES